MNAVAPSGVVTFLFTDIEGSTRRWETDPDAMQAALESYHAGNLSRLADTQGDPSEALDYVTIALTRFYDTVTSPSCQAQ